MSTVTVLPSDTFTNNMFSASLDSLTAYKLAVKEAATQCILEMKKSE